MATRKKRPKKLTSRSLDIVHENGFPKVTDVVDADEPLDVEVSENDVRMGTRGEHRICPYATACKRKTHGGVIIARRTAYIILGTTAIRYMIPQSLAGQIATYDKGGSFTEGTYTLNPAAGSHKIGAQHYGSGTSGTHNGNNKKKKHRFRHFDVNVRTALSAYKHAEVIK